MSPQIPDRPPRRRTQRRWPALLLIAGITLTVVGFTLTVGPLALDLGATDSPSADGAAEDPADTGVDADDDGDGTVDSDEATGSQDADGTGETGISATISTLFSGKEGAADAGDEEREKCLVD